MALRRTLFLVALFCAGCGGLRMERYLRQRPDDWPAFARTVNHMATAEQIVAPPLTLDWEGDVAAGVGNGSPVIVDSVVFVANLRGELHAFNAGTGKTVGWISLGDAIQGAPVIDGSVAFVALSDSKETVAAFDLFEGKPRWKKNYGDCEVSPLLYDQKLYFGTVAGAFFCIQRATGDQKWRFDLPSNAKLKGIRSSAAAESSMIVFGAEDGVVYALNAESGAVRWKLETGDPVTASPLIAGSAVIVGNRGGVVTAIDRASGKRLWRTNAGAPVFGHAVQADGMIVVGTIAGKAVGLRPLDGMRMWMTDLNGPVSAGGAVAGNVVYLGTLKKQLFAIRPSDGSVLWKTEVGGRIRTSPAIANGRLFIATDDRSVMAFREGNR